MTIGAPRFQGTFHVGLQRNGQTCNLGKVELQNMLQPVNTNHYDVYRADPQKHPTAIMPTKIVMDDQGGELIVFRTLRLLKERLGDALLFEYQSNNDPVVDPQFVPFDIYA